MTQPYISIVIVGRNDNYGVNFLERINTFVRHLDRQTTKYKDLFELIVVEWNPLSDRAPMKDVLARADNFPVRIITVPEHLHKTANMPAPVLEFWGKNVGIRRAQGEFVLVSNPDIIFSDQMIDALARKNLEAGVIYRTDRYDYRGEGIENVELEDYVDFAVKHTFQVHANGGTVAIPPCDTINNLPSSTISGTIFTNASGDFILSARKNFEKSRGLAWENPTSAGHVDSFSLVRLFKQTNINAQYVLTTPLCIFHMDHPRNGKFIEWNPEVAVAAADWAGWFAKPCWFNDDWGMRDHSLEEWNSKESE